MIKSFKIIDRKDLFIYGFFVCDLFWVKIAFFTTWIVPIICFGLAYYFDHNPIDDKNPFIYALLLIICLGLKLANFAQIIAD